MSRAESVQKKLSKKEGNFCNMLVNSLYSISHYPFRTKPYAFVPFSSSSTFPIKRSNGLLTPRIEDFEIPADLSKCPYMFLPFVVKRNAKSGKRKHAEFSPIVEPQWTDGLVRFGIGFTNTFLLLPILIIAPFVFLSPLYFLSHLIMKHSKSD